MNRRFFPRLSLAASLGVIAVTSIPLAFWAGVLRDRRPHFLPVCVAILATGVTAGMIATVWLRATGLASRPLRAAAVSLGSANLALALWFGAVDWVWRYEECASCMHGRDVFEYRIATLVVRREIEEDSDPNLFQLVAVELGVPCSHPRKWGYRLQRMSGLCWMVESQCGLRIAGPAWYPPCARDEVRRWLAADPGFAQTFRDRVLEREDRPYWRRLKAKMSAACPPDQRPEAPTPVPFNPQALPAESHDPPPGSDAPLRSSARTPDRS